MFKKGIRGKRFKREEFWKWLNISQTAFYCLYTTDIISQLMIKKESITTLHCIEPNMTIWRGNEGNFIPRIVFWFTYFRIVDPNHRSDIDKALKWKFSVWGRWLTALSTGCHHRNFTCIDIYWARVYSKTTILGWKCLLSATFKLSMKRCLSHSKVTNN